MNRSPHRGADPAGILFALSLLVAGAVVPAARAQDEPGEVIAVAADGTELTRAGIDSVLAKYPRYVQRAFRREGLVWQSAERFISFEELAQSAGPILWFSPDEPLLRDRKGKDIDIPTSFPFEPVAANPVVYYRVRRVLEDADAPAGAPVLTDLDPARRTTRIDLDQAAGVDLDFFFYYPSEEGLGAHHHDVESVEMKLLVVKARNYPELGYWIVVQKVIAKAHGILWYDNTLEVDGTARLPIHIMVEEGKHASCTDKNGDGYYSPGYDVNRRVNDAWGVRDVMATGGLYTGGFQSWMAKPRRPEHRVFPPLPAGSPLRARFTFAGVYALDNAIYDLRPFPRPAEAREHDAHLADHFIADKGDENWPAIEAFSGLQKFQRWAESEPFVKSVSIAYRYDGDHGMSFVFPLLVVKSVEDPVAGGWFVNRIYLKDKKFRDVSYNIMYATSASRWIDGYATFGWEWDEEDAYRDTNLMTEVGMKMRFNLGRSPLSFLSALTDFWGVRLGIKNLGIWEWDHIGYAVEIGAGTF